MFPLLCLLFLSSDPATATSLLQRGLVALQSGKLPEARSDLEQASKIAPQNAYIWSSLAQVYARLHETQLASSAATVAEKTGGENPIICHALAMYYSEAGQPARAGEFEERFAESPKADAAATGRAASLYLTGGDAQKALLLAEKAQQQHPSASAEDIWARALAANDRGAEANEHFRSAWQIDKTDTQIAYDWAEILLRQGDFTDAAEVVQTALNAHPRDVQLTLALGVARYGQRRFEEAISEFLEVIKIDPDIEQPYMFLGKMLDQATGRLPEITAGYERWRAKDPNNPQAQLLLAKALLAADPKSEQAEPLLRRSIRIKPDDWESRYELGVLLAAKHDYKDARDELKRSIELDPKRPMSHYHLARVYDRLGEPERAKAERELHRKMTTHDGEESH